MMNITLDQYIQGLEESAVELPKLLAEWATIDEDLQEEYADQLRWLFYARTEALQMAMNEGRYLEVLQRIEAATDLMYDHVAKIVEPQALGTVECSPNGLAMSCHRFDGWSFECEDGDHRDYMFPVVVEFVGQIPEDAHDFEYQPERHALIYSDGFVALTLYEHCYFLWSISSGDPLRTLRDKDHYRVSPASLETLRSRCPPKKPWGIRD